MTRKSKSTATRQESTKFRQHVVRISGDVTSYLNNLKLRDKMIIMCVICVLLPIIVTDTIFFSLIYTAVKERQKSEMKNTLDSVESTIGNMSDYMTTAAVNLYTTKELYPFLDDQYSSIHDYLIAYQANSPLLHKVTFGNNTYISKVQIYSDNQTLVNGGGVYRLGSVRDSDWYSKFIESDRQLAVVPIDDSKSEAEKRVLSFVCRMDYNYNNKVERVIKLNLNYNYFMRMLSQQYFAADVYICDSERVIFSTADPNRGTRPYLPLSEVDLPDTKFTSEYDMFGDTWTIYLYPNSYLSSYTADVVMQHGELFFILVIINVILPALAIYFINRSITQRIVILGEHLQMVKAEKYAQMTTSPTKDEIGSLIENYNLMVEQIENMTEVVFKEKIRRQDYELAKQRAELQALHSQINPHFIFNALESIRMRSLLKQESETAEVIELLAVLMRKSTDWWDDCVPLGDEISFAEAYLKLQQYRFGERISYKMRIEDDCIDIMLPKLTMVTFVENACIHGVEGVARNCMVLITAEISNETLVLSIEDTGMGMSEDQQIEILKEMREGDIDSLRGSHSVGILNACLRLRRYFGDDIIFEIDSEPNAGTCFTIRIPLEKTKRSEGGTTDA